MFTMNIMTEQQHQGGGGGGGQLTFSTQSQLQSCKLNAVPGTQVSISPDDVSRNDAQFGSGIRSYV